jgi:hypothetical protein
MSLLRTAFVKRCVLRGRSLRAQTPTHFPIGVIREICGSNLFSSRFLTSSKLHYFPDSLLDASRAVGCRGPESNEGKSRLLKQIVEQLVS